MFIVSTYTDGVPPESGRWLCEWVDEASTDFRVSKTHLNGLHFCVVALGNSLYKEHFCVVHVIYL